MKKLTKIARYILATVIAFVTFLASSLASNGQTETGSSLTGAQVFGGFVVLLHVILVPLLKDSRKANTNKEVA